MATKGETVKQEPIDLEYLFKLQEGLTGLIISKNKIKNYEQLEDENKVSLIAELYEMANELKSEGHKYWTKKKRTKETVTELADVLAFLLEMGNNWSVPYHHPYIEYKHSTVRHILAMNQTFLIMDGPLYWIVAMAQFRGLVELLGYDWKVDIIPAYINKHDENFDRHVNGTY